jgi:hypothetical protein
LIEYLLNSPPVYDGRIVQLEAAQGRNQPSLHQHRARFASLI